MELIWCLVRISTFEISGLEVPESVNVDKKDLTVGVKVKNTGKVAGSEVVQLYVHDRVSKIDKPYKQLNGFQKVYLQPEEEKDVTFVLQKDSFAGYSLELKQWITEPGEFDLLVGTSSEDLRLLHVSKCVVKIHTVILTSLQSGPLQKIREH